MDVSVIIVNYNTRQMTLDCLESIECFTRDVEYEVIVSDNGSTDGSVEAIRQFYPSVRVVENGENLGFGAANNRALKYAKGKYVFYLNSDTVLKNNAIKLFYENFENADDKESLGGLGCYLVDADGVQAISGAPFMNYSEICADQWEGLVWDFKRSVRKLIGISHAIFRGKTVPVNDKKECQHINGADLFVRNDEWALFDERFFLYWEETDMELQMYRHGKRFRLIDEPKIVHFEGGSQSQSRQTIFHNIWYSFSSVIYAKKNLPTKAIRLKTIVLLRCLNPFVFKRTKSFIPKVLAV